MKFPPLTASQARKARMLEQGESCIPLAKEYRQNSIVTMPDGSRRRPTIKFAFWLVDCARRGYVPRALLVTTGNSTVPPAPRKPSTRYVLTYKHASRGTPVNQQAINAEHAMENIQDCLSRGFVLVSVQEDK